MQGVVSSDLTDFFPILSVLIFTEVVQIIVVVALAKWCPNAGQEVFLFLLK